jgi:hypothetical protein
MKGFDVNRSETKGEFPLAHIFHGLEESPALQSLFAGKESTTEILRNVRVRLDDSAEYMYVDDATGTVVVSPEYLRSAGLNLLYLDIVHELVHVKQYREGRELFDSRYSYVDRPTELEAYRTTVTEARRVGMGEDEILRYLRMDSADDSELGKLMEKIGIKARR